MPSGSSIAFQIHHFAYYVRQVISKVRQREAAMREINEPNVRDVAWFLRVARKNVFVYALLWKHSFKRHIRFVGERISPTMQFGQIIHA
jgi:hypothetical protein